ncbi:hypothetical protein [Stenotrophomonas acidaminiphila]|uniref:hypothetical protein n=1 Tax=Stenotrophomonas acidaminiphila TaxID=128780 RepID=UPI0020C6376A|nr:hypothetical protein [Stenotrophomonas acidaminiphila]
MLVDHVLQPLSAGGALGAGQLQPPAITGLQERGRAVSIAARCGGWMGCWPRLLRRRSPRLQVLVDQALRPLAAGGAFGPGQLQSPAIVGLQEGGGAVSIAARCGQVDGWWPRHRRRRSLHLPVLVHQVLRPFAAAVRSALARCWCWENSAMPLAMVHVSRPHVGKIMRSMLLI